MQTPPGQTTHPGPLSRRTAVRVALGAVTLVLIVFALLFQWNWLRGPLSNLLSARLNRPVSITGNLEVHPWSWTPQAVINGLVIGNPPWAGPAPMAKIPRVSVQFRLLPLFWGQLDIPRLDADEPDLRLVRDAAGRSNWTFQRPGPPRPLQLPAIGHLIVNNGAVRFADDKRGLSFSGTFSTHETVTPVASGGFRLDGAGAIRGAPFRTVVTGGPLVNIDARRPYPFSLWIAAGATRLSLTGRIAHPFNFGRLDGRLVVSGQDLAQIYDLTGLPLPNTPPYTLVSDFSRNGANYDFARISARLGGSDLSGQADIDDSSGRPLLTATLTSNRVRLVDLAAVTGGAPRHAAGGALSPLQAAVSAKLAAEHRLLPDTHLDVSRLRTMDARVTYRAASVEAGHLPLQTLALRLNLDHGLLVVDPLTVSFQSGRLAGRIQLDGRSATPVTALDLRLTNARLESFVARTSGAPPIEGGLYARASLTGRGDSIRAAAASADGHLTLVVSGGRMRQAFAELLGIDATKGLFLLISKNHGETPIRCGIADFDARSGVLSGRTLVLDTDVVLATGGGQINLRDETLNLSISGKPKKFRLVRIGAPITLRGSFEAPKIGVDIVKAAPQAAGAVLLGAVLAPAVAILPFIGPGLAKDADCAGLTARAAQRGAPIRR